MGVTIEKCRHRARIGAHNNVKIKVDSTQLASNFCDTNTMLMLFQLVLDNNYDCQQRG